jgi:hypothetical protein
VTKQNHGLAAPGQISKRSCASLRKETYLDQNFERSGLDPACVLGITTVSRIVAGGGDRDNTLWTKCVDVPCRKTCVRVPIEVLTVGGAYSPPWNSTQRGPSARAAFVYLGEGNPCSRTAT